MKARFLLMVLPALTAGCGLPLQTGRASLTHTPAPAAAALTEEAALVSDSELGPEETDCLSRINAYRASNGLPELRVSATLSKAARWMSQDMADKKYFSHTDSLGRDFFSRIAQFGYKTPEIAENLAAGTTSGSRVFHLWKGSPGHDANMLGADYRFVGISHVDGYWTLDLGAEE